MGDEENMSHAETISFGNARKEVGSRLLKEGRYELAIARYRKVITLFNYSHKYKDEHRTKAHTLKTACELNIALCYLKLKDFLRARDTCERILKSEPNNIKALFRRASATIAREDYSESVRDLKQLLELDPNNGEAKRLLLEAERGLRENER